MVAVNDDEVVLATLKRRIVAEYREMPGLALTPAQAQRLWGCDSDTCRCVTEILVREGMLRWSRNGLLVGRG